MPPLFWNVFRKFACFVGDCFPSEALISFVVCRSQYFRKGWTASSTEIWLPQPKIRSEIGIILFLISHLVITFGYVLHIPVSVSHSIPLLEWKNKKTDSKHIARWRSCRTWPTSWGSTLWRWPLQASLVTQPLAHQWLRYENVVIFHNWPSDQLLIGNVCALL